MVSSRRTSAARTTVDEIQVKGKKRRKSNISSSSSESPSKRRKRNPDPFSFDSDEEPVVDEIVTGTPTGSTKRNTRKVYTGKGVNGSAKKDNSARRGTTEVFDAEQEDGSEMSDDELVSAPVTPSGKPRKTPTKTKTKSTAGKSSNDVVHEVSPPPSPIRTKFQDKLKAVAASSSPTTKTITPLTATATSPSKRNRTGSKVVSESITINGNQNSRPEITPDQLEQIKLQILPKLCGRQPIPLQGHSLTVAEYPPSVPPCRIVPCNEI